MKSSNGRGSLTARYLVALLAPAVTAGVMQVTWPFFEHNPVSPYLLAVIFSAWYGGLGPGLLSVVISLLLTDVFFIEPYFLIGLPKKGDLVHLLIFAVVGPFISVMSELMHRERRRARINLQSAKRAEGSLREKERFVNQIAELSPVVINVFDLATRRDVYISPDVVNLLGYTPNEIAEMEDPFSVLWHPEDITCASEHLTRLRLAADGTISEIEYRIRHRDGEWRWMSSRGMPFARDEAGVVRQIVTATVDITDRKRADDALRSQKEILQKIFDHIPAMISFFDADGRIQLVNLEWERWRGWTLEEILSQNVDLLAEGYPDPEYRQQTLALASNSNGSPFNLKTKVRDGRVLDTIWSVVNLSDGTRIGLGQDITERKRVERAQRESQRQYEALVQSIDGIVWEAAPKTFTFTFVSKQAERILGYPLEQWFEGPGFWPDHMHPDDRDWAVSFCVAATARRVDHQFEYRMIAADGHVVWLSDMVTVHVQEDQSVLLRGVMVNITERKLAEENLRQSESQLAEAQHLANVGSWNWNLENNTLSWSDELHHIFGVQPSEFDPQYETVIGLLHPEDRDLLRRVIDDSLKTHEPFSFYYRIIRPDGKERIIHSRGRVATNEHGTPARMFGAAQDVTERKRAEDSLREAERKYRDIFENAGEGIFQSTPDGRFIAANPAFARMHGFASAEELIRRRLDISRQIYVDPSRREEFKRQLEEQGAVRGFEHQVFRKDGSQIWISVNARAVRDEQDAILYYEGTAQDITDRKRAEEALRESEKRYRDLVENSRDLICTHDLDGLILSANRAALEILGSSSDSYQDGTNLREILAPEVRDQFGDYLKRIRANGVASGLMLVQTKTGERRIWEYHNTLRTQGVFAPIVRGMARDITERRLADDALRLFRTLLDQSSDAIEVIDPNTLRFLDCSESAYHDLGYTREEFLSLSVYDIDPLIEESMAARQTEEMDRSGFVIFESVHRRKDGSTFPVEVNVKIVHLERDYRLAVVRDITERKLAEEALGQAEQKYRDIFENAGEGIFQSTPDGRFIAANPALARMLGFASPEDLIRCRQDISRQIYVDPSRREEFKRELEEQGAVRGIEHQVFRKDGSQIWISVNARAVRGEQGAILYYEGTAQDITDRKRAEQALRVSEERYRELFENAKDAIYVQDLGGVYISVNRAAEKLSGYDRKDIIGKHFNQFVAPEYLPLVRANLSKKLADGEETACEIEVIARGGRRVPVELSSAVIFKHGVPVGIQGIARDITKRKRAEDDLRQQKEILQKIFDHIPVMIRLAGPDGDVQLVNREYERTTGWSLEEIQKEPLKIFAELYPDKHERQLILDRIARATGEWADFRTRGRDGRVIDTSWANIRLSAGMSLGIGQDISVRKRAEETLRSYSRQLIEAQEAERQHIARELHDQVGQVLTAVRINLQTIWNLCETAESRSLIDQGVAAIDTALEQVRNLSFELRPSLLDDLGLVSALRWYSDQYTQRTGIRTRSVTNLPEGQTRLRRELETACFRIVQEALTNVVRHAKAKNVFIDLSKLDHKIVLSIKDDGIGFHESSNGGASAIHLGLRGMKERALAVGGTLDIESGSNRGTQVRAHFPTESKED